MITTKHVFGFVLIATSAASIVCMRDEISLKKQIACAHILQAHTRDIESIEYYPDGKQLISSAYDHTIKIWDLSTQSVVREISNKGATSIAIDKEGKQYASSAFEPNTPDWLPHSFIKVWNPDTSENKELHGHRSTICSLAFHPLDSTKIASGSGDSTIKLWDINNETCLATLEGHKGGVTSIAHSPDGINLASGSHDGSIIIWHNGKALRLFDENQLLFDCVVFTVAYNPTDSNQLASGNASSYFNLWDTRYERSIFTIKPVYPSYEDPEIKSVAYKPDGTQIACGKLDGTIELWDVE